MGIWCLFVVLSGIQQYLVNGAPAPKYPPKEMIGFMKSYGYLQDKEGGSPAETLYTEEGFREVIRQVQKFGGLNETGELDPETLALMDKPRCGVPDVIRNDSEPSHLRRKRYVIATPGWKRRRLSYFLSNWGSKLDRRDTADRLRQAFDLWSEIAPLRFVDSSSPDADIVVAFGSRSHGDSYPFDGPGNTLAHAFFPYQQGPQGGDIHFDNDENWIDTYGRDKGRQDGVDFLTVATHEIGHSLGLAHSPVQNSIMFPYYKGYTESLKLGYDDVLAMYDLYVKQGVFEDGPLQDDNSRDRNRQPDIPRRGPVVPNYPRDDERDRNIPRREPERPRYPDRRTDEGAHRPEYPRDDPNRTGPAKPTTTRHPIRKDKDKEKPHYPTGRPFNPKPTKNPSSDGHRPGVGVDNEGRPQRPVYTTRVPNRTPENGGRDKKDNRTSIPDICRGKVDAVALLRNELFVFKGLYMWRFKDRGNVLSGYPSQFHHFFRGLPRSIKHIDAIYQRPTDHNIIFFSGRQIWTYTGDRFTPDSPRPLTSLGLPAHIDSIDASFVWSKNEKTYFFKGQDYWRYDDRVQAMDQGYPMKIHTRWVGVPDNVDAAVTFNDAQTYFFKDLLYWRFDNIGVKIDVNFPRNAAEDWIGC